MTVVEDIKNIFSSHGKYTPKFVIQEVLGAVEPLEKQLAAIKQHFPKIEEAYELLIRYSSKRNLILKAGRLETLRKQIKTMKGLLEEKQKVMR